MHAFMVLSPKEQQAARLSVLRHFVLFTEVMRGPMQQNKHSHPPTAVPYELPEEVLEYPLTTKIPAPPTAALLQQDSSQPARSKLVPTASTVPQHNDHKDALFVSQCGTKTAIGK